MDRDRGCTGAVASPAAQTRRAAQRRGDGGGETRFAHARCAAPCAAAALCLPLPLLAAAGACMHLNSTSGLKNLTLSSTPPYQTPTPLAAGTIGHVAHGKSTVVKAITGVQTVRFKNELERNITIKLG